MSSVIKEFLVIVLGALFLCACSPVWFLTKRDEVLTWPAKLETGHYESPKFKPLFGDRAYRIELSAKRALPFEMLACYMGTSIIRERCLSHGSLIAMRWEVWDNGELVASGMEQSDSSNHTWSNESTERFFGSFVARPNVVYQMKIDVLRDGTLLSSATPEFRVYACRNRTNENITCTQ